MRKGRKVYKSRAHGKKINTPKMLVPLTPAEEEQIARMAAAGATKTSIAARLRRSLDVVNATLAMPAVQEFMLQCREATRAITLAGVQQTQSKAMGWLDEIVDLRDPRAFDSVSRGILNLEKTGASASGESRPQVQVAVVNQQQESEEIRSLIRALAR